MSIEACWPKLRQQTRQYLIDNNGDVVPPDLAEEITRAGGVIRNDACLVGRTVGPSGLYFSDDAIDWTDEAANGEPLSARPRSDALI